jgi:outer membrane protein
MRALTTSTINTALRAACGALVFFNLATADAAAPTAQQYAMFDAMNGTQRVQLLIKLAKSGDADAVEALLQKYPLEGPYARNRGLYIQGLLQKASGDYTGAAETFRTALASDPGLTLVRAELAETLVILEQDDSALHHLRLVAAEAPNEGAASSIRSFIDRVDSRTPFKFSGYVSLAPSSNLNNGSKRDTVYLPVWGTNLAIDDGSKAKSGIGVAAGGSAAYAKRLGNDYMLVATAGAAVRIYDDSDFNSYTLSQSAELRRLVDKGYLSLGLVTSQTLDSEDGWPSYASYGPRVSASMQLAPKDHLSTSATYEWRSTLDKQDADGTAKMFDAAWMHAFDSTMTTTVFGGLDIVKMKLEQNSYYTVTGGLSLYKELTNGITVSATGQIAKSEFAGFNPMLGETREDTRLSGSLTLTKRDLNLFGFAPSLTYSYANNMSNSNLYDNDSHGVDMRLTKDF